MSAIDITDPDTFRRWWQSRDLPNDRKLLHEAVAAGLVNNSRTIISLTEAGRVLRRHGVTDTMSAAEMVRCSRFRIAACAARNVDGKPASAARYHCDANDCGRRATHE